MNMLYILVLLLARYLRVYEYDERKVLDDTRTLAKTLDVFLRMCIYEEHITRRVTAIVVNAIISAAHLVVEVGYPKTLPVCSTKYCHLPTKEFSEVTHECNARQAASNTIQLREDAC